MVAIQSITFSNWCTSYAYKLIKEKPIVWYGEHEQYWLHVLDLVLGIAAYLKIY